MTAQRPNNSRPNPSGPTFGNAAARPGNSNPSTRPANPGLSRPSLPNPGNGGQLGGGSRPGAGNLGGNRPSLGGAGNLPNGNPPNSNRPNINRPSTLPGTRPGTVPGDLTKPAPGKDRPNIGTQRPGTLPGGAGGINRPNLGGERPSTRPGLVQPPTEGGNRPNINNPNVNRPNTNRPNINRPNTNRPNINNPNVNLPGIGNNINNGNININRPGIGGTRPGNINNGNNIVNRPGIGGNRPGNINIGNSVNIGNRPVNRPNWDVDPGFSRPNWGINSNNWHNNWHNHCVNNHHNWYNGCWHGYWGSSWYAPVAWGAVGWGLNSWTSTWGNSVPYYNPYYASPVVAQESAYDYSQPVVVNNYVSSESDASGGTNSLVNETPAEQEALTAFDSGLDKFKSGDYRGSLRDFDTALKLLPGDAVVHETRCLALYAVADYSPAAAGLNSFLAAAPGMDWTTMSGLYGNIDDYTTQLRSLEKYADANPTDASSHFVLAYHYLVTGSKDSAIDALEVVMKNQPKDVTAKRMLAALLPAEDSATATPPPPPASASANVAEIENDPNASETDLVGTWIAQSADTRIELGITEDSAFTWKANAKGQPAVELKGNLNSLSDGIELETAAQGTIAGAVKSNGPDGWVFLMSGAPASDPGLTFKRNTVR